MTEPPCPVGIGYRLDIDGIRGRNLGTVINIQYIAHPFNQYLLTVKLEETEQEIALTLNSVNGLPFRLPDHIKVVTNAEGLSEVLYQAVFSRTVHQRAYVQVKAMSQIEATGRANDMKYDIPEDSWTTVDSEYFVDRVDPLQEQELPKKPRRPRTRKNGS
jgi:hypothetical protein